MGKSKHFKELRKFALKLPQSTTGQMMPVTKIVSGNDALKAGIKKVSGKKVNPGEKYVSRSEVPVLVNHYRKMKRAYVSSGVQGVRRYVGSLDFNK